MKPSRLGWSDLLRCLACAAVVILHCAGATLAVDTPGTARFFLFNLLDSGVRWSVPVFIMLSGMFLLDPDRSFSWPSWRKRILRLALLALVAAYLFALWDTRQTHPGAEHLLEALILLVRGELHYHLWFLPMLLGLYLLIPPMRALIRGASRRTLWYVVGLWGVVTLCLGTLHRAFPGGPLQAWLNMLNLQVAGYAGYFLLGYLLKTCDLRPRAEKTLYALGALGLIVTWGGTELLSRRAGSFQLLFYSFLAPNVALTAAALFLLARRLDWGRGPVWAKLSRFTLWVYLLHPLALELLT